MPFELSHLTTVLLLARLVSAVQAYIHTMKCDEIARFEAVTGTTIKGFDSKNCETIMLTLFGVHPFGRLLQAIAMVTHFPYWKGSCCHWRIELK